MAAPTVYSPTFGFTSTNGASIVVNKPSGLVEGDWLIACNFSGDGLNRWYSSVDWTTLATLTVNRITPSGTNYIRLYCRKATASEPSTYSFAPNAGFGSGTVMIVRVSGARDHADIPFVTQLANYNGSPVVSPSISPSVNGSRVLRFFGTMNSNTGAGTVVDNTFLGEKRDGTQYSLSVYTQEANAGPTGTKDSSSNPASGLAHAVIAIAPASTPPEAFDAVDWAVADATTGSRLLLSIDALPTSTEPITDIEYRLNGGAPVSTGLSAPSSYLISGLTDDQPYSVEIRALSSEGAGPWSDTKAAIPTFVAPSSSAIVVNGSAGMLYTGRDVPRSWQNDVGFTDVAGDLIPRNEAAPLQDADGNLLQYRGRVRFNARAVGSHCFTFNGTNYIDVPALTGSETVVSSGGTATPSIAAGRLNFTAGTAWNVRLSNGMWFPLAEGAEETFYEVNGNAGYSLEAAGVNWTARQDEFHYNLKYGFKDGGGGLKIPASQTLKGRAADGLALTNPPRKGHNGAETLIDFSPVEHSWSAQHSIPGADLANYAFDGNAGDLQINVNTSNEESQFNLPRLLEITAPVSVLGSPFVGVTLEAVAPVVNASDAYALAWQWLRNGAAIAGATSKHYTLTPEDAGQTVTVRARVATVYRALQSISAPLIIEAVEGLVSDVISDLVEPTNIGFDPLFTIDEVEV